MQPTLIICISTVVLGFPQDTIYDFRSPKTLAEKTKPVGVQTDQFIQSTPQGMVITLPAEQAMSPIGCELSTVPKGDFELTMDYDVLEANKPKAGYGIGLNISLEFVSPTNRKKTFGRFVRPKEGAVFRITSGWTNSNGSRTVKLFLDETRSSHGELRVRRKEGQLILSASENGGDFRPLKELPVDDLPLQTVRITGETGGGTSGGKFLVKSVNVREGVTNAPPESEPQPNLAWIKWALAILGAAAIVFALFLVRRRRAARRQPAVRGRGREDGERRGVSPP